MAKAKSTIPWLGQEDNGVYYVYWYDARRRKVRRSSLGTREASEAQPRFAAFLIEHARVGGEIERLLTPHLTVDQVLTDYDREHVDRAIAFENRRRQRFAVENLRAHFGGLAVTDISVEVVDQYCARRRAGQIGKPSGDGTLNRELGGVLIPAINHAVRRKRLTVDQAPDIQLLPPPPPKDRWLKPDELAALFSAALGDRPERLPRVYRFIAAAYYTASRKGALLTLTRFQIDTDHRLIYLNPKGRLQTKKRRPTVPIFAEHLPIIERAEAEATSEWHLDHTGPIRWEFEQTVKAAGLEGVTPHTLRHTRATHMLQAGVDPWAVAGLLGDTLATVMRVYGHHCPGHIRAAVEKAMETPGREIAK